MSIRHSLDVESHEALVTFDGDGWPSPADDAARTLFGRDQRVRRAVRARDLLGDRFEMEIEPEPGTDAGSVRIVTVRDATPFLANQRAASDAHEETQRLLASVPVILAGEIEGELKLWNAAAERAFDLPAYRALGNPLLNLDLPWDRERIAEAMTEAMTSGQSLQLGDVRHQNRDGETRLLDVAVNPVRVGDLLAGPVHGVLLVATDITEQHRLERQLAHRQTLEAIGSLAAGIAHEINTPTQYVNDNLRFVHDGLQRMAQLRTAIESLLKEARAVPSLQATVEDIERLAVEVDSPFLLKEIPAALDQSIEGMQQVIEIIHAMRQFSHPGNEDSIDSIDVNTAVTHVAAITRNRWKAIARLDLELAERLPPLSGPAVLLNQVLINLLTNAVDAVAERIKHEPECRGLIRIQTERRGDNIEVRVTDNGAGVPEQLHTRVFEPFFTTKPASQGSGQGLAITRTIVTDRFRGSIHCANASKQGAAFTIRLPVHASPSPEAA